MNEVESLTFETEQPESLPLFNQADNGQSFSIKIHRNELLKIVSNVQAIVEKRNTIAILNNLLLKCEGNRLTVSATDMDIIAHASTNCETTAAGEITVPASVIYDILRKLPDSSIISLDYEPASQILHLKSSNCNFKLPCLAASEFPYINEDGLETGFQIEAKALKKLIDQTRFAISTEETRYYLNGIYFHPSEANNKIAAVATDLHRLALIESAELTLPTNLPAVIVPRKTIAELHKLLDNVTEPVEVALSRQKIKFSVANEFTLVSKLIDGNFPDYKKVIPANNDKILKINRTEFLRAIDLVTIITEDKTSGIKLKLGQNNIIVSASNANNFSGSQVIDCEYTNQDLELGFNPRYLIDALNAIQSEEVVVYLANHSSPIVLKNSEQNSSEELYLIMPMRVV